MHLQSYLMNSVFWSSYNAFQNIIVGSKLPSKNIYFIFKIYEYISDESVLTRPVISNPDKSRGNMRLEFGYPLVQRNIERIWC
jgi:hypothetical protein